MKRSRFTVEQIIGILREQEAGILEADRCRKPGLSSPTFYNWKPSMAARMRQIPKPSRMAQGLFKRRHCVGSDWPKLLLTMISRTSHFQSIQPTSAGGAVNLTLTFLLKTPQAAD